MDFLLEKTAIIVHLPQKKTERRSPGIKTATIKKNKQ